MSFGWLFFKLALLFCAARAFSPRLAQDGAARRFVVGATVFLLLFLWSRPGALSPAGSLAGHPLWNDGSPHPGALHMADVSTILEPMWRETRLAIYAGGNVAWTDSLFAGCPVWGNPQAGILSPWHLGNAMDYPGELALWRWLVAALGGWLLARRLGAGEAGAALAGAVCAFNGPMTTWLLYPMGGVLALWPLLIYLAIEVAGEPRPRRVVALALVMAGMVLSGHPESAVWGTLLAITAAFAISGRRHLRTLVGTLCAGGLLAAPMWMPFLAYLGESARMATDAPVPEIPFGALLLGARDALLSLVHPFAHGVPWAGAGNTAPLPFEETTFFVGLVPLALAARGLWIGGAARRWALAGGGLFWGGMVLSLLNHVLTPASSMVHHLPLHRLMQGGMIPLAVAAALAFPDGASVRKHASAIALGLLAVAALFLPRASGAAWESLVPAVGAGACFLLRVPVGAMALGVLQLLAWTVPILPQTEEGFHDRTPPAITRLAGVVRETRFLLTPARVIAPVAPAEPPPRLAVLDRCIPDQALQPWGFARFNAWDGLKPGRIDRFAGLCGRQMRTYASEVSLERLDLFRLAGVAAVCAGESAGGGGLDWRPLDTQGRIHAAPLASRSARWIETPLPVKSAAEAFTWLEGRRVAFSEDGAVTALPVEGFGNVPDGSDGAPSGVVTLLSWRPGYIRLRVEAARPGVVMLAATAMPGWRVSADGGARAIPQGIAGGAFLAFVAEEGSAEYDVVYDRIPGLALGIVLACFGAGLLVLLRRSA